MLIINNRKFKVGIISLKRTPKRDYKYDLVTEDGVRRFETRAIYQVYNLTLGNMTPKEYDALYNILVSSETVTVTLPEGQGNITFEAICDSVSDGLEFVDCDGKRWFDGMSIKFTATHPMEVEK